MIKMSAFFLKKVQILLLLSVFMCSCGGDDESAILNNGANQDKDNVISKINVDNVFQQKRPKSVGEIKFISYGKQGLVTSMLTEYGVVDFFYKGIDFEDRDYDVWMRITENQNKYDLFMKLNEHGFVNYCIEDEQNNSPSTEYWWFKYNADSQLNYMKRSEGGNEETFITYSDGDIVEVVRSTENTSVDIKIAHIKYTTAQNQDPLINKGNIMLFDNTFSIDMDEMKYAYYAGLLGKSTLHLPLVCNVDSRKYSEQNTFHWVFDNNGFPLLMNLRHMSYTFRW